MKNTIIILFATNIVPILCMNEQKPRPQKQSLFSLSPYSNENQNTVPIYITANEPGWQQYNQIMNAPYTNNTPMIHNPIDLMPIYIAKEPEQPITKEKQVIDDIKTFLIQTSERTAQIKKEINEREEKILQSVAERNKLIYSINKQLHPDIMKNLYNEAYNFAWNNWQSYFIKSNDLQKQKLISLIKTNLHAYNNGINEDIMGQFTYDQWSISIPHDYTPLIFNCLKQYRLTTAKTQEYLPDDIKEEPLITPLNEDLAKALGITDTKHIASTQRPEKQTSTNTYPAYKELIKNLTHLLNLQHPKITILSACLYNKNKTVSEKCPSHGNCTDLAYDFYDTAQTLLTNLTRPKPNNPDAPIHNLYDLILIIDKAKKTSSIQHEKELGHTILNLTPPFFDYLLCKKITITYMKNTISLICIFIEKYNEARKNKITPTPEQLFCYIIKKNLNFALPDSFDKRLFDENAYALTEFNDLLENIDKLNRYATLKHTQQCVDTLYPTRK